MPPLMIVVLTMVLAACGQPAFAAGEQTIRGYADVVTAADLTRAWMLMSNPSIDWKETTARMLDYGGQLRTARYAAERDRLCCDHHLAAGRRLSALLLLCPGQGGAWRLEMVNDGSFICPDTSTAPAP
jgi:hypothetical protein